MTVRERLIDQLVSRGIPAAMAAGLAEELAPKIEQALNLSGEANMYVSAMGAGVSVQNVQNRIHLAVPTVAANDYGSFMAVSSLVSAHPDWSEDQVYNQAVLSFVPKSKGGLTLTPTQAKTKSAFPALLLVGGGVIAAALLLKD